MSTASFQMDADKSYPFISPAKCSGSKRDPTIFAEAITGTTLAASGARICRSARGSFSRSLDRHHLAQKKEQLPSAAQLFSGIPSPAGHSAHCRLQMASTHAATLEQFLTRDKTRTRHCASPCRLSDTDCSFNCVVNFRSNCLRESE